MATPNHLAEFLRARRESLTPEDVGLPRNGRRRTPGLRREEVATLAGVSIDYLVRLEQGRDTNPSGAVVSSLADALQLSEEERSHLGLLVAATNTPELCPSAKPLTSKVRPTVAALLESLDPTPAFVVGPLKDVLAWNGAWAALVRPLGMLDDEPPNLVRYTFLHPEARTVYADWERMADDHVSQLRATRGRWCGEDNFKVLVAELLTSPDFATRWETHLVGETHAGIKAIVHPDVGALRIAFEALRLSDDEQLLITWLPADEVTAAGLRRATATEEPVSPAHLRIVADA
jgi:transcriptional regulator with XRE-family HTH domain